MGREHTAMSSFAVIKTLGESRRNWKMQYVGVNALNYDEKTKPITVRIGLMKLLVFAQCSTFMCALHDKHWLRKHILLGDHQLISNMWLFWYNKAFIRFQTAIINFITRSLKSICILLEFWIISVACFGACFQIERLYLIREPCRLISTFVNCPRLDDWLFLARRMSWSLCLASQTYVYG